MDRSILDTDTFSEILRRRDPRVVQAATQYLALHGHFTLTVITLAELVDGFRRRGRDSHIGTLIATLGAESHVVIPLDFEAAKLAGLIFGDLHRSGQPIGRADPFIAAIAIQADVPLVTGNASHFRRIQALGYPLRLDNWRDQDTQ